MARLLLFGVGALLGLVLLLTSVSGAPTGYWAPSGYVAQADTLIQQGAIRLQCPYLDPVGRDSIIVSLQPGSEEEAFYYSSYLRTDVRAFNLDPRSGTSPFLIEGCQLLGVNPYYHRIDLPGSEPVAWRGDVRYTTYGRTASLVGDSGQSLEIRHPASALDPRLSTSIPVGFARDTSGHALFFTAPAASGYLASVTFIGADPVFIDRRRITSEPTMRVNGLATIQGRPLRLEEGDWVRFEVGERPPTYLVDRETRRGTASLVRVQGGQVERQFLVDRDRPFVEPLARAMDEAIRAVIDGGHAVGALADVNIRLSVDLPLMEDLDGRLQAACRAQPDPDPDRPRGISFLVMDGFTGEVRAMPSCPDEAMLDDRYPNLSDRLRELALRNQNLVPHPIGSAGKPFWAASVATRFPNFLDLRIPPSTDSTVESVLGCPLRTPFENSYPTGAPVGLETYIEQSCNRYQVLLSTAALLIDGEADSRGDCSTAHDDPGAMRDCLPRPAPGGESTRLAFCDRVIEVALTTDEDIRGIGSSCHELQELEAGFLPLPTFRNMANVSVLREPLLRGAVAVDDPLVDRFRTARYRIDAWRDVFDHFEDEGVSEVGHRVRFPFSAVSPQATNLQLNTVRDLRSHWVSLLLGGENSQWSNFQLAESLARLMSGRAVVGRFVSEMFYRDRTVSADFAALPADGWLHGGVRRRVLHAMELVVEGGTARRLRPLADRLTGALRTRFPDHPFDVYVFAKTGSPYVLKRSTPALTQILERLVREGNLRWDAAAGRFDLPAPGTEAYFNALGQARRSSIRARVLEPIERAPGDFREGVDGEIPDHPLYLDRSDRVRVSPLTQPSRQRGAALLLGVLAVPRDGGREVSRRSSPDWVSACDLNPRLRDRILEIPPAERIDERRAVALSTALFVDDLPDEFGVTSRRAIEVMMDLFPALETYLVREVAAKLGGP